MVERNSIHESGNGDQMMEKDIITVPVSNLVPGTIVARDVYTRNNQLLIPKDYVIDERVITRITLFGILSVPV